MNRIGIALYVGAVACALVQPASAREDATLKVLHAFEGSDGDGATPAASVIDVNGMLYGTTMNGGANYYGAVYALDLNSGTEKVLYSFCKRNKCPNGEYPLADLIDVNGTLYGTTIYGGAYNYGTVFALDPNTGRETILHSFACGSDGCDPSASLIDVKGTLYGTTQAGGNAQGGGVVFAINSATGNFATLYDFCSEHDCADGLFPNAALIDVKGTLYGATVYGGAYQNGLVFALDPATGTETVVYSFCRQRSCKDGALPYSSLIDVSGTLYGTTSAGGIDNSNYGTVYAIDPGTGAEKVLHSFCSDPHCKDGALPYARLTSENGMLYGTTTLGGSDTSCDVRVGCGVVFALDPGTGAETVLHSFHNDARDGGYLTAGLIAVNGTLYGVASSGGIGFGTVYSLKEP